MKPLVLAGIVLVGLGAFVVLKGLSYSSQSSVLKVGDLKVSAEEHHLIPPWVGVVAIVGGIVLVGGGVGRRHGA
jgi:hypothetical protein